jgi:hypothetical protein
VPRNPRPLWLARFFASDKASRTKKPKNQKSSHDQHKNENKPVIRVFDQSLGGVRTEVNQDPQDPADEAFLESLESTIQDVKKEMSEEGETEEIDDEEVQDRVIGRRMEDMFQGEAFEDFMVSQLESQMDQLDAEVDKRLESVDVKNMSEEELSKVKEELYQMVKDSMAPLLPLTAFTDSYSSQFAPANIGDEHIRTLFTLSNGARFSHCRIRVPKASGANRCVE